MGTGERIGYRLMDEVNALQAAWRARLDVGAGLGVQALAVIDADGTAAGCLVASVLAGTDVSAGADDDAERGRAASAVHAAAEMGRAASQAGIGFGGVHAMFDALREALFQALVDARANAAADVPRETLERGATDASRAVRPVAVAAEEGWFDERGRAFRHDIKTPLQAASLNLELLALEGAGTGLDTEAIDVIQRSLDQAVELIRSNEPGG